MVNFEAFLLEYSERTFGMGHALSQGRDRQGKTTFDHLLEVVPTASEGRILDVGCGDGYFLQQVLEAAPRSQVFGLDLSTPEIQRAEARGLGSKAQFVQGRAECLPYSENSMDIAFCHLSLGVIGDVTKALTEIHRVLQPGGVFSAIVPGKFLSSPLLNHYLLALDGLLKAEGKTWLSNLGDPRIRNEHGLQSLIKSVGFQSPVPLKNFELQFYLPPEELVELFLLKYDVALLSPEAKLDLRNRVLRLVSAQVDPSGRVRHLAAFRQITVFKNHDV
jgi:ubiquinone/menaquinone biosynthesis C-methylase UbiE